VAVAGRISIGTSSWADPGFVEEWYPEGLPPRERLPYYAKHFDAVEVNSTFYAIPAQSTTKTWAKVTPKGFTFDVKLHRVLSRHAGGPSSLPKDLRARARTDARGRVKLTKRLEATIADAVLEAVEPLGPKLSTFLLQLTPAFGPRDHKLDELAPLVERLNAAAPVAIELRNRLWLHERRIERTLGWFEEHGAVFVCVDAPQGSNAPTIMPPIDVITREDVAYLRAHGRNLEGYLRGRSVAERFGYRYSNDELREIGERAGELASHVRDARVMFNNNRGRDAPDAAQGFKELVLGRPEADRPHQDAGLDAPRR
jgi:uncharacterized protein YecE (DUF72 family)